MTILDYKIYIYCIPLRAIIFSSEKFKKKGQGAEETVTFLGKKTLDIPSFPDQ